MTEDLINVLIHAGKKGMKWGVRKAPLSPEHSTIKKLKKNRAKSLSDTELKQVINRMNLEKQYRDLKTDPETLNRTVKVALSVLAVGTTINSAINFANSPAGKAVKDGVVKILAKSK